MICLYHCDDDGKCAAAIVRIFGHHDENYKDTYIEMNYGYKVPFKSVSKDETVYIVDFSIDPADMHTLLDITNNVIWIDHHFTAIEKYDDFGQRIEGVRCTDCSGCMLTYLYLTNQLDLCERAALGDVAKEVPKIIRYVDDYDMWKFRMYDTRAFHRGFALVDHDPEDAIWDQHLKPDATVIMSTESIIDKGETIIEYRAEFMKELIGSYGYESNLDGHKCFVLNQGLISSDDFDSIKVDDYDLLVGIIYDGKQWHYSLRSAKIDVGTIAKSHGGGGHKGAAGFASGSLIFKKAKPSIFQKIFSTFILKKEKYR